MLALWRCGDTFRQIGVGTSVAGDDAAGSRNEESGVEGVEWFAPRGGGGGKFENGKSSSWA